MIFDLLAAIGGAALIVWLFCGIAFNGPEVRL